MAKPPDQTPEGLHDDALFTLDPNSMDDETFAEVVAEAIENITKTTPDLIESAQGIEVVDQAIRDVLGDSSGLLDHLRELLDAQAAEVGVHLARRAFEAGVHARSEVSS
jgi:hypothetical protein